ncbi:MAG: response regulator transcription factor [Blastocatellia bacterium]|nr:response regulator transcription factor [Blastocatellia bacterium]
MARILIVDDEPAIVLAVRGELNFEGFEVDSAADGHEACEKAREFRPDVMLLDLGLPGMNGFEVCRRLRAEMPAMWIIMLTVRGQEVDRVMGLELGADDYVTKPFSLREIVARVKVGLRRKGSANARAIYRFGRIEIDLRSHRVLNKGREVALTRKEFEILEMMAERAGQVITRDEFLDAIWGEEVYVTHRVIDTHIAALRKKIEDDPNNPIHILSVRGIGYKLD